jgi:Beta-lactamase enzyme family
VRGSAGDRGNSRNARGRHAGTEGSASGLLPVVIAAICVAVAVVVTLFLTRSGPATSARGNPHPAQHGAGSSSAAPARHSGAPSPASSRSQSLAPVTRQASDPLGAAAASYLAGRDGTVLAEVDDLSTRQSWVTGHGRPQDEASIVKLDILETLLSHQQSELSGTDESLAQSMIEDSDNDSATALWDAAGGASGIGSYNSSLRLRDTSMSSCVQCPGFPWPGWGLSTTTPADQIALLRAVVEPASPLSKAARHYALSLLEDVTPSQRWGVSAGVPPGVRVALKNGWLPLNDAGTDWQVNSIGWIDGQGRNYLIAVVSTGNPDEQYGIDTIEALSELVWAQLH